jgi:hypothetical protein
MPRKQDKEKTPPGEVSTAEAELVDDLFGKPQDHVLAWSEDKSPTDKGKTAKRSRGAPVWVDDDDQTIEVNLATGPSRLRKLRSTEKDTVVSGPDFEERLRARFVASQQTAAWATLPEPSEGSELLRSTQPLRRTRTGQRLPLLFQK